MHKMFNNFDVLYNIISHLLNPDEVGKSYDSRPVHSFVRSSVRPFLPRLLKNWHEALSWEHLEKFFSDLQKSNYFSRKCKNTPKRHFLWNYLQNETLISYS